ncbi:MAG TPA: DUF4384 domain-containing protein [Gemmatimonadaceae bacterium]|nr:DUF4384 domain-containing protein [Gemmatimonadaceae bacterium]
MSPTASTAARVAFAAGIVVVAASTALGAQDTTSSSSNAAAPATLGHAPSAPAIRVSLGEEALAPGERGRVSVRTRSDGYVVVLHADPAGRVRVLFPLDPGDSGQRVRADSDLVVRSRGGGRDAFTAGSAVGDGIVLAAVSASRPFRGTLYAHNGHWDPLALPHLAPNTDAEGVLLALVGNLLPKGAHFDYDVATYRVSESTVASTVANGGEVVADEIPVGANGYDNASPMNGGYGANVTSGYGYEDWSYAYGGYYGGIFPIVIVPATYYGAGYGRGYGNGGGFRNCIDPFYIALGCPPVYHAPYPTPHSGYRPGDGAGRRGHSYGIIYTTKPRPAAPPSAPTGYRPRPTGGTPTNGGGMAPATVYRSPPPRTASPPATTAPAGAATSAPVRAPWGTRRIEQQRPAASAPPPLPATSAPARTTTAFPMRSPVIWRAPASAAPSPPPPPPPASTRSAPAPERHASPGGSRTRPQ